MNAVKTIKECQKILGHCIHIDFADKNSARNQQQVTRTTARNADDKSALLAFAVFEKNLKRQNVVTTFAGTTQAAVHRTKAELQLSLQGNIVTKGWKSIPCDLDGTTARKRIIQAFYGDSLTLCTVFA
jgi:hypothetical protein